jgi:hypothetical protein
MIVTRIPGIRPECIAVRVDPHDGTCKGQHDIIVEAMPYQFEGHAQKMHVTLTWGVSVVLSIRGSQEFADALDVALGIARQIEADGEYRE